MINNTEEQIMAELIEYARLRMNEKNIYPFAAFVVKERVIISKGYNDGLNNWGDKTTHGEMVAISKANKALESKHLVVMDEGYELYSTCEPCLACFDTALWSNIKKFIFSVDHTDFPEYFNDHPYNISDYEEKNPGEIIVNRKVLHKKGQELFKKAKEKYGW